MSINQSMTLMPGVARRAIHNRKQAQSDSYKSSIQLVMHIFLHKLQSCATSCTDLLCLIPRGRRSTLSLTIAPTSLTQNERGRPLFFELPGGLGWLRLTSKVAIRRGSLFSSLSMWL